MRGERIDLRVTWEQKASWLAASRIEGVKLAEWIIAHCNAAAPSSLAKPHPNFKLINIKYDPI